MIYRLIGIIGSADCMSGPDAKGRWSRSIPLPYYGGYVAGAWAVLRGHAIALKYPEAGELEAALQQTGGIHVSPAVEPREEPTHE